MMSDITIQYEEPTTLNKSTKMKGDALSTVSASALTLNLKQL